jgi:sialidase-1
MNRSRLTPPHSPLGQPTVASWLLLAGLWLAVPGWATEPPATQPSQPKAAPKAPAAQFIVTVARSTPETTRKGEGDVIELDDGRLLLIYMEFSGTGSDFAKTRFVAQESADGGRTWSHHRVVTNTAEGDLNVYSPNLIRAQDGGILLMFMRQHRPGSLTIHVWKSTDEGTTFSPWAETAPGSDLALCNATVKRLASGRLLLPANPPAPGKPAETGPYAATVLFSDDDGRTWTVSKSRLELAKRGAMEPHVEQTATGRVLMVMRNQLGRLHVADSTDDGATWSAPRPIELQSPESCPELVRLPGSDHLVMIWNNSYDPAFRSHFGKRSPLTAAISRDHGKTWQRLGDIETDPQRAFSNPGCRFTKQGRAIVNYWTCEYLPDWAMQDVIDLRVAVLEPDWFR